MNHTPRHKVVSIIAFVRKYRRAAVAANLIVLAACWLLREGGARLVEQENQARRRLETHQAAATLSRTLDPAQALLCLAGGVLSRWQAEELPEGEPRTVPIKPWVSALAKAGGAQPSQELGIMQIRTGDSSPWFPLARAVSVRDMLDSFTLDTQERVRWFVLTGDGLLVCSPAIPEEKKAKILAAENGASWMQVWRQTLAWGEGDSQTSGNYRRLWWTPPFLDPLSGRDSTAMVHSVVQDGEEKAIIGVIFPVDFFTKGSWAWQLHDGWEIVWDGGGQPLTLAGAGSSSAKTHASLAEDASLNRLPSVELTLKVKSSSLEYSAWMSVVDACLLLILLVCTLAPIAFWFYAKREVLAPTERLVDNLCKAAEGLNAELSDSDPHTPAIDNLRKTIYASRDTMQMAKEQVSQLEKKLQDQSLKSSWAETVLDYLGDMVVILSPKMEMLYLNKLALKEGGFSEEEQALGLDFSRVFAQAKDKAPLAEALQSALQGQEAQLLVFQSPRSGSVETIGRHWVFSRWHGAGEDSHQIIGIGRKPASVKEGVPDLVHDRDFLQITLDHLPVAVYAKDFREGSDGLFVLWNRKCADLFGVGDEEALGKSDYDFLPRDIAETFLASDQDVMDAGMTMIVRDQPVVSRNLGPRRLRMVKAPIFSALGDPLFLLCVAEDVTQKIAVDHELQRSKEQVKMLVELAPDAILIAASDGHFIEVNQAACSMLGYPSSDLLRMGITDIHTETGHSLVDVLLEIEGGNTYKGEHQFQGAGKKLIVVEMAARRLPDGRIQIMLHDISERKILLADLRAAHDTLDTANLAKDQFLAALSSETRVPLDHLSGYSTLLRSGPHLPEQEEAIDAIAVIAGRLAGLFKEMQSLIESTRGVVQSSVEPFDIGQLLRDAADKSAQCLGEGFRWTIEHAPGAPHLLVADSRCLRHAVESIFCGAYSPGLGAQVVTRIQQDHSKGADSRTPWTLLVFEILGISASAVASDFQDTSVSSAKGRNWVLCRRLVQRLGGEIKLDTASETTCVLLLSLPSGVE